MLSPTTAAHNRVRELADRALASTQGIAVRFTVTTCGNLANAKAKARSVQTSFNSMRSRDRKDFNDAAGVVIDQRSVYDALICQMAPMGDGEGYVITLARASLDGWDLVDLATGQDLRENDERLNELGNKMRDGTITVEEGREFVELNTDEFQMLVAYPVLKKLGVVS